MTVARIALSGGRVDYISGALIIELTLSLAPFPDIFYNR